MREEYLAIYYKLRTTCKWINTFGTVRPVYRGHVSNPDNTTTTITMEFLKDLATWSRDATPATHACVCWGKWCATSSSARAEAFFVAFDSSELGLQKWKNK